MSFENKKKGTVYFDMKSAQAIPYRAMVFELQKNTDIIAFQRRNHRYHTTSCKQQSDLGNLDFRSLPKEGGSSFHKLLSWSPQIAIARAIQAKFLKLLLGQ